MVSSNDEKRAEQKQRPKRKNRSNCILLRRVVGFRPATKHSSLVLRESTRKFNGPSCRVLLHDGRATSISKIMHKSQIVPRINVNVK